jgi:hypothetical protein
LPLARIGVTFLFLFELEEGGIGSGKFFNSCRRHRKSIHNHRLWIGVGSCSAGRRRGFLLPEPERLIGPSGGYYTFGAGAWSPKNGDEHDSQMNAVFGIVVSTGEKRRIQSQMGLVGRCLRPQSLQLFFQDLLVAWAWFSATCGT